MYIHQYIGHIQLMLVNKMCYKHKLLYWGLDKVVKMLNYVEI